MIYTEIRCDGCGFGISKKRERPHLMRQKLEAFGWKCSHSGGEDYCPECIENHRLSLSKATRIARANRERVEALRKEGP